MNAKKDLQHFLSLAAAQIKHRLKLTQAEESYSERINQLRLLEELVKEQVPHHATTKDSRSSAGKAG